jgi:hypothetical protein
MKNKLLVRRGMFCAMVVLGLFVTAFFTAGPADDVIESSLLSQQGLTVFVNKQ